jgi:hypothetical protein
MMLLWGLQGWQTSFGVLKIDFSTANMQADGETMISSTMEV